MQPFCFALQPPPPPASRPCALSAVATGPAHPRAHVIQSRTLELLRAVGLQEEVIARMPPPAQWTAFRYCGALLGAEFASVDHRQSPAFRNLEETACSGGIAHLMQPKLGMRGGALDVGY